MSVENESAPAGSALARLVRWESFGGHWRIGSRTATRLEIRLLTCDGGEEADRFETGDDDVLRYIGTRMTDQDDDPEGPGC